MLYLLYFEIKQPFRVLTTQNSFSDSRNISCMDKTLNDAKEMTLAAKQEQDKLMGISFFTSGLVILFLGLLILLVLVKVC